MYVTPAVRDYGGLAEITAQETLLVDATRMAFGLLAQVSAPVPTPLTPSDVPNGGGGGTGGVGGGGGQSPSSTMPNTTTVPSTTPDSGGVLNQTPSSGGSDDPTRAVADTGGTQGASNSGSGGVSGGSSGGSGGSLPFTGLAAMGIAALGVSAASAGTLLRRLVRRPEPPQLP